ncbi:hypothetical protein [Paenibacillus wenxiniae]|uniref:Uncharacterized protein n=1 Tax=Paenibacillus wenxiniae TaxID=1636843 RepID=A0ABW4RCW8_9BACL
MSRDKTLCKIQSENNHVLVIKVKQSAVIFEIEGFSESNNMFRRYDARVQFSADGFTELLQCIEQAARYVWSNIEPKEANSVASDYDEYYDKEFDNNGYLSIGKNVLNMDRPWSESDRFYKFNKAKMGSFIYDFKKRLEDTP